jgi:hypothetical protein
MVSISPLQRFNTSTVQLQLIQGAPIRFLLCIFLHSLQLFPLANAIAISVAAWMGWQVEQEVLAYKRREIDRLWPMQFSVHGKCGHLNFVYKFLQARYATQLNWLGKRASCPKRASGNAQFDVVMQPTSATNSLCFEVMDRASLVAVQVQTLWRNLFEMNFHASNLSNIIN